MRTKWKKCSRCGKILDPLSRQCVVWNEGVFLCMSCDSKLQKQVRNVRGKFVGIDKVEQGAQLILEGLRDQFGLDINDENFRDTPRRISRSYWEIFEGIENTEERVKEILSTAFPSGEYESIIFCPDIVTFSMCPHHLLPVEYSTCVGYIPSKTGKVLGASKLARLVDLLAKRPVLQEKLTTDIAEHLDSINPEGVGVVVSGVHYCMRMRGVKKMTSFQTSAMKGVFMSDPKTRKEFFDLLALSKR